tara:strand:+ start:68 stop:583 length:516 start_codon:yes stop_codon:yes gene_type:complete
MASKNYIFYKIFTEDCDDIYVGSTADFKSRKNDHKNRYYNENHRCYNLKIYQTIRANGGWSNWKMIQIGTRDNITKREAEQIEEEYRLNLKATMNMCRAFITPEDKKEYNKEYQENNKEKRKEYDKKYRENNKEKHDCECGGKFTLPSKSCHLKTKRHCEYINRLTQLQIT